MENQKSPTWQEVLSVAFMQESIEKMALFLHTALKEIDDRDAEIEESTQHILSDREFDLAEDALTALFRLNESLRATLGIEPSKDDE
nr:MAG: hypothetical protein [Microvirus sp.]